jgi:acetylornithine/succinyldiaminopimelate/putrescine aminotransferase
LAAAAVAATIDIVREERLPERAELIGNELRKRLDRLKSTYSIISDVRGLGLMLGIEIGTKSEHGSKEMCELIVAICEDRGLHLTYTYHRPVIRLLPSLLVTNDEVDEALKILDESIGIALKDTTSIRGLTPQNPYSRRLVERLRGGKSLRQLARRIYDTTPKELMGKLSPRRHK